MPSSSLVVFIGLNFFEITAWRWNSFVWEISYPLFIEESHEVIISFMQIHIDVQFIAGCGKFFEGTAEQMYQSLCVTLGSLPKPTQVYCGHEVRIFFSLYLVSFFFSVPLNRLKFSHLLWTRSWGWMHDLYECSQLMWTFNWYHNNQINCMHVLCMFLLPLSLPWRSSPPSHNGTLLCWVLEFKRTLRVHVCDQSFAVRVLLEKLVLKA